MDATKTNPSNAKGAEVKGARKRIPMSTPTRRLEIPEMDGWHLHWFVERNVPRALQAGYEFVDVDEVPVNQRGVGTDSTISGSADLGSRVKQIAGIGEDGKPEMLVLMKLREEWWLEDKKVLDDRNASVLGGIFREEGIIGAERDTPEDRGTRYIDRERTGIQRALFNRPPRKA